MRFCHVTTFYPPHSFGGDGILVRAICEALARRGHRVDVVYCTDAFRLKGGAAHEPPGDQPNLRHHPLHSGLGPLSPILTQQTGRPALKTGQLQRILSDDYDVVNFHNVSLVGGPGVLALSRAPVTLYTTHEHWLICPTHVLWKDGREPCEQPRCLRCCLRSGVPPQLWRYTGLVERELRNVDAILSPSQFTASRHQAAGITRPIHVIEPFSPSDPGPVASLSGPDRPRFVYAGRLVRSKGIEQLLESFEQRPGYELLVAGEGPLEATLRRRYRQTPNVRFLGRVPHDEVLRLYRQATAAIVPSWGPESFGLGVVEALAASTPVIVRRAGGNAEAVAKTGGGLVYDDIEELLPLVDRIGNDPDLRGSLARKARAGFETHYTEQRFLDRYLAVIESLGSTSSGARSKIRERSGARHHAA